MLFRFQGGKNVEIEIIVFPGETTFSLHNHFVCVETRWVEGVVLEKVERKERRVVEILEGKVVEKEQEIESVLQKLENAKVSQKSVTKEGKELRGWKQVLTKQNEQLEKELGYLLEPKYTHLEFQLLQNTTKYKVRVCRGRPFPSPHYTKAHSAVRKMKIR